MNKKQLSKQRNSNKKINIKKYALSFACVLFTVFIVLPNVSVTYAKALEKIPVIGSFVEVITIRHYFYEDDYHKMNINVPKIKGENEAFDFINADVEALSNYLVEKFYDEVNQLGNEAHSAVYVDYDVVTDTKAWFTLKLQVNEATGSGNTYFKYYHLNKLTGTIMNLEDIVANQDFYSVVEQHIKSQMKKQMEDNEKLVYWVEDNVFGDDLVSLKPDDNFYWNKDNNLVIPFDKYEAAPGFMGTYEFVIDKAVIKDYLRPEIQEILFVDIEK